MPVCTKFFVQYGSEAGNVYTIMLNKSSLKQHSLVLARMALEVIANNKSGINQKHSDSVCRLAQALREAVSSKTDGKQDYISQPQALDICGLFVTKRWTPGFQLYTSSRLGIEPAIEKNREQVLATSIEISPACLTDKKNKTTKL